MIPYLLILSFVLVWIKIEKLAFNRNAFLAPLIILVLFSSIRSYHVGSDSYNYVYDFINNLDIQYFKYHPDIEIGYQFFTYLLLNLTSNYFWLFFTSGLIINFCYLKIINKYSINYLFSVYLFICLGTYTFFFNGLRQGLAMAIFCLAYPYLFEKKIITYILICIISSFFHISAIFMIPFYFLVNFKIKLYYKVFVTFITSLLTSQLIISYFAYNNPRYQSYTETSDNPGGLITSIFYISLGFFTYIIGHIYKINNNIYNKLLNFYICGISLLIPIIILGTNPSGPQRLLNYFTFSLIFLIPTAFKKINNKHVTVIFIIVMLIYFILSTYRFSNLVPFTLNPIFHIL